jgi:hypothetical protein
MGSIVDMILEGRHARIEEKMLAQRVTMDDMLSNAGSDGRLSIFFDSRMTTFEMHSIAMHTHSRTLS